MTLVADRVEDLTPEWLTAAFRAGGHELVVTSVSSQRIGTGQMGTTYLLQLTYRGAQGPASVVAKLPALDQALRVPVATGYAAEVGFYNHVADTVSVRRPHCWYGAIADGSTAFTLLLEDATPAVAGVQVDGCTVEQARAAIRNLVGLHAPRWSDPRLRDLAFLRRSGKEAATFLGELLTAATEGFIDRYSTSLTDQDAGTLRDAAQVTAAWEVARPEPFAVIHGDYRLDNLLFSPSGDDVIAVDWQGAALGPPLRDVAFFLGTSLDPRDRRSVEEDLVADYHEGLVGQGISGYGADQCWGDYRIGQLHGPMVIVLGCMYASGERSGDSDAMFLTMVGRSCAAIRELRSIDLV